MFLLTELRGLSTHIITIRLKSFLLPTHIHPWKPSLPLSIIIPFFLRFFLPRRRFHIAAFRPCPTSPPSRMRAAAAVDKGPWRETHSGRAVGERSSCDPFLPSSRLRTDGRETFLSSFLPESRQLGGGARGPPLCTLCGSLPSRCWAARGRRTVAFFGHACQNL